MKSKLKQMLKKSLVWTLKKTPLLSFIILSSFCLDYAIIKSTIAFTEFMDNPVKQFVVAEINVARAGINKEIEPIIYALTEAQKAGFDPKKIERLIGDCENKQWNTEADYVNYENRAGVDRGLWMLNSISHKEVSNSCAYDLKCSTKEALRILKQRGYKEWSCGKILGL